MTVCYNKLWKLLIDKGINKIQFCKEAKITTNVMAKLRKNEDVRVEVLAKICVVLNCRMDDIMDIFSTENNSK
ncbi:helix-turn-helix domain-containing protein [Blautia sp.]|jgi:putative transcriptional regulator|uniref:helix-turn-helix domain-containing protein n=1 Tax=Blautia sp. TaxID=1955243 RepID=UPI00351FF2A4